MKNKFIKVLVAFSLFSIIAICIVIAGFYFLTSPVNSADSDGVKFKVNSGATIGTVAHDLFSEGLIRSSQAFYVYGRLSNTNLQAGIFNISPSMSVSDILAVFESGRFESIRVSIPEGLTTSKIGVLLEAHEVTSANDFIQATKNKELLAEFDLNASTFEGFLFPDTYYFDPDMTGEAVVRILVTNFFTKLEEILLFENVTTDNLYEKIILASIVEREYRVATEAPLIASVFINRINQNIGLYSCATLEYIITEIQGKPHPKVITYDDIQIDNPYNTYMWAGLPPTPISNPGLIALKAAINPADTNYYYFRLIDASIGNHVFTTDFDDHIEAGTSIQTKSMPS